LQLGFKEQALFCSIFYYCSTTAENLYLSNSHKVVVVVVAPVPCGAAATTTDNRNGD